MAKKTIPVFILLFILLGCNSLLAQVTFFLPDSGNNLGLINPGGLMGFAWGDYDDDGDLDLWLCGGTGNGTLYRNDVADSNRFVRVSAELSAEEEGTIIFDPGGQSTNSALWGDFNGDGALDLLNSARIFLNYLADSGRFVFNQEFLPAASASQLWGTTTGDFDADGDLDLAFTGGTGANGFGPLHILQNNDLTLTDVALDMVGFEISFEAWNPAWVDVNNDGWLDLWMPNIRNAEPCALFINQEGLGLLYKAPGETGIDAQSAIANTWGDYNNDGYMDLWLHPLTGNSTGGNLANQLYMNNGNETFTDVAPALGMDSAYTDVAYAHRGAAWGDYDNDGDKDLLLGRRAAITQDLWKNNGDGTFTYASTEAGIDIIGSDIRSTTFVDYDNDGWLDIYIMQNSSNPPYLLKNQGGNGNHWVAFKPKGVTNNTTGIGARIWVVTGSLKQVRDVYTADAGGTNGMLFPHFGLGSVTTVDSVIIRWPNGVTDVSVNVPADQYYTIQEGVGVIVGVENIPQVPSEYALYQNYPNPFNPTTTIAFNLPVRNDVHLTLINILGQTVKEIASGNYDAGIHEIKLDASGISSGVYFYKLEAGDFVSTKKLILMK